MSAGFDLPHCPRLYSAAQVRELDRQAIEQLGIPGYTLMQRAAAASWNLLRARWPDARRIAVFCGPGNNGGDGYELARLALKAGCEVQLLHVGAIARTGDAVQARQAWVARHGEPLAFSAALAQEAVSRAEVICDAIFGIGMTRAVDGEAAQAIAAINARAARQPVLALDVPSGLDADTGAVHGTAVQVDVTISFIGRKLGLYLGQGPDHAGLREYDALGVPASLIDAMPAPVELLDTRELERLLAPRRRSAHKGTHGHVLLVGGDAGMSGALLLAVRGALRAGAGRVSAATRAAHALPLTAAQPEAMFHGVEQAVAADERIRAADAVAIGPGLGQGTWARALLDRALRGGKPLVLDADALNLLGRMPQLRLAPNTVITPHPGEAARLLNTDTAAVQADRLGAARALRERYGAVVVLKGAGTLVCGQRLALCPLGNPGMGVGGMGDVLSGVIAALLGQGLTPEDAARVGVLAHARAGDLAASRGERGMIPQDLIEQLRTVVNPGCGSN